MLQQDEITIQKGGFLYMGVKFKFLSNYKKFKSYDAYVNDKDKIIEIIFHKHSKGRQISTNIGTVDSLGLYLYSPLGRLGFFPKKSIKVNYETTKNGLVLYVKRHCK